MENRLNAQGNWLPAADVDWQHVGPYFVDECRPLSSHPRDFIKAAKRAICLHQMTMATVLIPVWWLDGQHMVIVDEARCTVPRIWQRLCEITNYQRK